MSYNIGKLTITVAGESHSKGIGIIIEGMPSGAKIDFDGINKMMKRRAARSVDISTARMEEDIPEILSGIKNDITTGAPIMAVIKNNDVKSADYGEQLRVVRPGHADYSAYQKYGESFDFCGGGQFSGRLTAPICFAGAMAKQLLKEKGIEINAHILSVGNVCDASYDEEIVDISSKAFPTVSDEKGAEMKSVIIDAKNNLDSVGGIIECAVSGIDAGIGGALFDGLDGEIAKAVFGVPGVKGVEFGAGFKTAKMLGSENNDEFYIKDGKIETKTNNHGGILGGITSGMPIIFKTAFKPTPSIAKEQCSVDIISKEETKLCVKGRHDPCIVPRAVPVIESVCALVILGEIL